MKFKLKRMGILLFLSVACVVVGISGYRDSFITSLADVKPLPKMQKQLQILPDSPYTGQFTTLFDRLGIVRIRISTGGRINRNTVVFRLREVGKERWLVENAYVTDRFIDGEKYPFGFPVITDSKGKNYEYELTTIDGSEENTVAVSTGSYAFQTDYIYSKALILTDRHMLFWFFKEKAYEMFRSFPHVGYWMMCLLPLLMLTNIYVLACIGMIILFGFLPMQIHSNMVLWIGISTLGASLYKKNHVLPFILALFTLVVCVIAYFFGEYDSASKLATIIPILLTIGCITTYISIKH